MFAKPGNTNLTSRQEEILKYLRDRLDTGNAPSYREIGEHFGIKSTNGVKVILDALERKGYLSRRANRARGIELTELSRTVEDSAAVTFLPLLGRVAAGEPILAEQNIEGHIPVDSTMLRGDNNFALEVKGDSMIEAGIFDGDIVFAREQPTAITGEMIVAQINNEATVKFYFPETDRVRLQPANGNYQPIWVEHDSEEFRIVGKVTGLLRRY
jgi:repressor LexA